MPIWRKPSIILLSCLLALYLPLLCMKKIIVLLSVIVPLALTACSNQKDETKKEVIIVPASPAPATAPAEKNTTVVVDKNGVKVGTPKVDVTINPEKKK